MRERNYKEIQDMISEEMPELVELFDKKQLDSLVNSLIVNDHTRRMSLKEILAVLKEARDSQLENAVETLKAELMKPESFGQILEQVSPVKGRDYFTEEEKESFAKKVASKIRTPRAGVDYFTESEKTTLSNYLHNRIYKEVLDELLLRKEYAISSVDIEGLVRKVAGAIKIPEYQPESADKIAKKLSTLFEAIPVKAIKGAVTMDDVLKALKDPKGKHKLSAGDILNMPARGPLDQRWHGAGISEVTHDSTLTGTGTPDSPLSVVGGSGAVDSVNGQTGVVVLDATDVGAYPDTNPDGFITPTSTSTLTNKRITPRVVSMADATSFTPTGDTADENTQINTQAVGTLTANAPSGTPTDGQRLILRIKSTNVQTFSWNAIYRGSNTVVLPVATTGSSKTDYFGFIYNFADTKWDCVSASYGYT